MNNTLHRLFLSRALQLYEWGVLIFAFSLPNFESLKHLGFFMMVLGFVGMKRSGISIKSGTFSLMEWVIIAILTASTISTILNWPLVEGMKGLKHIYYHLITFWILYRTVPDDAFLKRVAFALVTGTLAGIMWEFYQLLSTHPHLLWTNGYELKFNSINSVSRAGAFNATILFVCLGVIMDMHNEFRRRSFSFFIIAFIFIFSTLLIMGGRGNTLATFAACLLLSIPLYRHKRYQLFIGIQIGVVIILIAGLLLNGGDKQIGRFQHLLSTKFTTNVRQMALHDQMRYDYWRIGLEQRRRHPSLLGMGPRNFKSINVAHLELTPPLLKETLELINTAPQHSHNWLITKWVEDGTVGILLFLSFLGLTFRTLWRQRPSAHGRDLHWVWMASIAAMTVAVFSGLFNSAFTHENGWLTFFIMGLGAGHAAQSCRRAKPTC